MSRPFKKEKEGKGFFCTPLLKPPVLLLTRLTSSTLRLTSSTLSLKINKKREKKNKKKEKKIMIKLFYQKDPLWANIKIPGTNLKLKDYGCNVCNLASLACYYGKSETPKTILSKLKFVNGLVIWKSFTEIYPDIEFVKRIYKIGPVYDFAELEEYLKNQNPVIAEVRLSGYQHFILIYSKELNYHWMLDPALNINAMFEKYYSKIYGLAFFRGYAPSNQTGQQTVSAPIFTSTLNVDTSIVDYLKSRGLDSSFLARKKLYEKIFGEKYFGTKSQNQKFLNYAKSNF